MTPSSPAQDRGRSARVPEIKVGKFSMTNAKRFARWALVAGIGGLVLASLSFLNGTKERDEPAETAGSTALLSSPHIVALKPEALANTGIEVASVARGAFRLHRDFPATVQPNENELAEVTTLIRGQVVEVSVDVGQDVKKGALLALLHSSDLGLAAAAYLKAGAKLHEAELAYERVRDLHQHRAVSLAEVQRREAEMKTVRAEAREAKHRLELLGARADEFQRLDREQTIRSDVPMRAPFDGRVIMRNITRGEVVETQQKLFTVADLSDVWVVGKVPEKDVRFIHREQVVEVRVTSYPGQVFVGTITHLGDVLDPATRTMRLRVTVPNPKKLLKPEMFATVRVYADPEQEVAMAPVSAVQRSGESSYVFVQLDGGRFEKRPVVLGQETDQVVAVLSGLREGELIVTAGTFVLKSEFEKSQIEPTR
ncbi:MAG: efflux RND transporter periplasmic adaptor subunit [Nitrospira sp.]|nr:efflux RND transporter periplasmic adaptor subunit [Nitrospira sp.]